MLERDETRVRAEAAEQRADKFNRQRAAAQDDAAAHVARIAALEQAVVAAAEATKVGQERLRTETQALQTHIECAEERGWEAERRRDALAKQIEAERVEHSRLVATLHRAEEKIMEEQVRISHDPPPSPPTPSPHLVPPCLTSHPTRVVAGPGECGRGALAAVAAPTR